MEGTGGNRKVQLSMVIVNFSAPHHIQSMREIHNLIPMEEDAIPCLLSEKSFSVLAFDLSTCSYSPDSR